MSRRCLLNQKNPKTIILLPAVTDGDHVCMLAVLNGDSFSTDQRETASHNGCWWVFLLSYGESCSAEGLMVGSKTVWWFPEHVRNVGQKNTVIFLVSSSICVAFHPCGLSGSQLDEPSICWKCRHFLFGIIFWCVCVVDFGVSVFMLIIITREGEGFSLGLGLYHCFDWANKYEKLFKCFLQRTRTVPVSK